MTALTTRQRDLIQLLLNASVPQGTAQLAAQLHLTPRQVNYDLKSLQAWLQRKDVPLHIVPGVGVSLGGAAVQQHLLRQELQADTDFQLVLGVEERRQLLALFLFLQKEPVVLRLLEKMCAVSRTTIIKDLDVLTPWFEGNNLHLARRPNYGIEISGSEQDKRQALGILIWGDPTLGEPIFTLSHTGGIVFQRAADKDFLPILKQINRAFRAQDLQKTMPIITQAEVRAGGRFTDDAVLYLSVLFMLQARRLQAGFVAAVAEEARQWAKNQSIWPVAGQVAERLAWFWPATWSEAEIALIAMHLMAAPRNESWPGDLDTDAMFTGLVDELMMAIEAAYAMPGLRQDKTLRDGIINNVLPACLRQRFQLWMPPPPQSALLPASYAQEHALVANLIALIQAHTQVTLPAGEVNNLALLVRAAYVRERPTKLQEVLVVCPSGMATAQLLVARLKANFPRLGAFRVISLRELYTHATATTPLIITTAPLPDMTPTPAHVIRVHPLLLPEDIEHITAWLDSFMISKVSR